MPSKQRLSNSSYWNGKAYLNTAAEGLPLQSCVDAVQQYLTAKSHGEPGRVEFWKEYERAKQGAARLFSVDADQIALISSTTEALNTIAHSIDWRPGDEVVFTSSEFPSNIFPWVALQSRGVKLRIVHPGADGISVDDLLAQINDRTRLVTVSQVSYATGEHLNPEPLWRRVQGTPTLLCVDATQAAGRVPVDGRMADFTVASAFKWMNSIHGAAIMSVSRRALRENLLGPAGWLSAESCFADDRLETFHPRADGQRFQAGMPNFDSVYSLAAALDFHTPQTVKERADRLAPLVSQLRASLVELGLTPLVPEAPSRQAGIVPFAYESSAEMKRQLAERGIFVQGDDRRIRAALHWYNTEEDVEQYLTALGDLLDDAKVPTTRLENSST
ncbi:aminotransferase class V-fold PLP-dependent enzyme [Blastopirellula sp. J2-11]|uniref:aminotransferase class V-fold PLP-dependent enzyme n=1 Tax=Blastopirellula sp. J2-11 TaxID=2943192 RepID=UPI0021C7830C|nr:aminotransferase class V-fold PLP-dependent enzyme [Blastopirellula sp. J2-11]UUO04939.1 aminotransferase class V-fold PLP-dependent enzyme [Blastopirellula sp. J2-11]